MASLVTPRFSHLVWKTLQTSLRWAVLHRQTEPLRLRGESFVYVAFWVHEGSMRIRCAAEEILLGAGQWAFLLPGARTVTIPVGTVYATVGFEIKWSGGGGLPLFEKRLSRAIDLPILEEKSLQLCARMHTEVQRGDDSLPWRGVQDRAIPASEHFQLRLLFHDWLRSWVEVMDAQETEWCHVTDRDSMFVLVIYYLENLEFGKPIDLPALAHFAGTHPRRFVETFRAHYGLTPHAWRERYRLRQAVHQLQETALPIKEIAAEFHLSPTYFTTWIKKWTGYSALDLRHQQPLWGEGTR